MPKYLLVVPAIALSLVAGMAGAGHAVAQNNMSTSWTPFETKLSYNKTDIEASPEAVFAVVEDFRSWPKWMWPDKAEVKRTFSGSEKGKGAIYEWEGTGRDGSGRAQIVDTAAPGKIVIELDLKAPVAGHLTWVVDIKRVGGATTVAISTAGRSRELVKSSFETILGASPSLIRLGCVAGGEPYKGWCETFMIKIPALEKERAAKR